MEARHLENPFPDYDGGKERLEVNSEKVRNLICDYVDAILENTKPGSADEDTRGDLYVGNAGIAYMFYKLAKSNHTGDLYPALDHAQGYIRNSKANALRYKKRADERVAFLCGNSGIYAVSAAVSQAVGDQRQLTEDVNNFLAGYEPALQIAFTRHGCDEVLVGRAGYLTGCYWLNDILKTKAVSDDKLETICKVVIESGRQYSKETRAPLPLMYQYHGTEYLGAAHGLSAILHVLLDSPWFKSDLSKVPSDILNDVKASVDFYLSLQDAEGNFPVALEDLKRGREKRLVHWCHGAPGAVYLLAKAYLIFKEDKYLRACKKASDLVWQKGLLRKGPGICHGVAGSGYVFLLLYRLTEEEKYLYRAVKFMEYLTNSEFKLKARIPDRPFSLYEGVAGTVCFLIDLLDPKNAHFPFMEVFH
ncbi:lanC-like protein 3 homolog [Condylostylus longicornis]|uniref:lanC-like protein 3 homolog n=1 Tax=Condylostylus longicornis TaxID=2530218 RepID=UPI00244DAD07|nr:lanC-like protein 3 homolog [Condylostylus longicornis]